MHTHTHTLSHTLTHTHTHAHTHTLIIHIQIGGELSDAARQRHQQGVGFRVLGVGLRV